MSEPKPKRPACCACAVQACAAEPGTKFPPAFCPMEESPEVVSAAKLAYSIRETGEIAAAAARTEAGGYCRDTRVEEIMHFARRIGVDHIGIACCIGLRREARAAAAIFSANGFEVSSVICKVGSIPKEELGLDDSEKIRPGGFEAICNPVAQAALLDNAGCGLNVLIGLCVGHDSLFFRHSKAPVTVLVAKDRVTGHNPAAVLYTSESYYRRIKEAGKPDPAEDL